MTQLGWLGRKTSTQTNRLIPRLILNMKTRLHNQLTLFLGGSPLSGSPVQPDQVPRKVCDRAEIRTCDPWTCSQTHCRRAMEPGPRCVTHSRWQQLDVSRRQLPKFRRRDSFLRHLNDFWTVSGPLSSFRNQMKSTTGTENNVQNNMLCHARFWGYMGTFAKCAKWSLSIFK